MRRKVVTIDGLAGSGKSSISALLASKLGFCHLSSGLLYRALAHLTMKEGVDPSNEEEVSKLLVRKKLSLISDPQGTSLAVTIDGARVSADLMSDSISKIASKIAAFPKVRELLIPSQRDAYLGQNIVAEGRDMGTVIFPNADAKFFVEVTPEVRAKRRSAQIGGNSDEVLREILDRDHRDTTRAVSPALPAKDAITIDNSHETLENVVQKILSVLGQKGIFAP